MSIEVNGVQYEGILFAKIQDEGYLEAKATKSVSPRPAVTEPTPSVGTRGTSPACEIDSQQVPTNSMSTQQIPPSRSPLAPMPQTSEASIASHTMSLPQPPAWVTQQPSAVSMPQKDLPITMSPMEATPSHMIPSPVASSEAVVMPSAPPLSPPTQADQQQHSPQ